MRYWPHSRPNRASLPHFANPAGFACRARSSQFRQLRDESACPEFATAPRQRMMAVSVLEQPRASGLPTQSERIPTRPDGSGGRCSLPLCRTPGEEVPFHEVPSSNLVRVRGRCAFHIVGLSYLPLHLSQRRLAVATVSRQLRSAMHFSVFAADDCRVIRSDDPCDSTMRGV